MYNIRKGDSMGRYALGLEGTQLLKLQIIPNKPIYNKITEHHIRITVLVEVYKGTRRKHNMKFRQIDHTTSQYGQSFFS